MLLHRLLPSPSLVHVESFPNGNINAMMSYNVLNRVWKVISREEMERIHVSAREGVMPYKKRHILNLEAYSV